MPLGHREVNACAPKEARKKLALRNTSCEFGLSVNFTRKASNTKRRFIPKPLPQELQ